MFLHGWGGSIDSYRGIANVLSQKYRCILVDFAGFGETKEPELPYTLSDYTKDLDTLLDELNIKRCFFVAHSFGGRVALDYSSRSNMSAILDGMVLCDVAGMKPRRSIRYYTRVVRYKIKKRLGLDVSNMGSSDYRQLSTVMRGTFVNIVNEHLEDRLHNIHTPTLLIWGDKDMDTPMYQAYRLKKGIEDSALIVFPNRGHFAYLEEGGRVVKIIDSFVEGMV